MIKSFKHKGLKLFWVNNDASKLPSEYIKIIINDEINRYHDKNPKRIILGGFS
jgi:hypothetical protein